VNEWKATFLEFATESQAIIAVRVKHQWVFELQCGCCTQNLIGKSRGLGSQKNWDAVQAMTEEHWPEGENSLRNFSNRTSLANERHWILAIEHARPGMR
jgi:hypothetical protein